MDYFQSLEKLRREVFAEEPVVKPVRSTGFVPQRQSTPVEDSRDLADRPKEWLKQIKAASADLKTPKTGGGFAAGLADAASIAIDKKTQAREDARIEAENKVRGTTENLSREEKLIRRRSDGPSTYAPRASSAATFEEAIDATEGGGRYDTLFGHSQKEGGQFAGTDVSNMTIAEAAKFSAPSGAYGQWVKGKVGRVATPMGRYQFVGTTLKAVAKDMGLSPDTVFSPEVQDSMFHHYLGQKIAAGKTMEEKISNVRSGWEGFKSIPTKTLEKLITEYEI